MSDLNVPANGAAVNTSPQSFADGEVAADNTEASPTPDKAPGVGRPKRKGPSIDKQWADRLLADTKTPWYAEANHTSGGVAVHRWNGSYLQFIGGEEGSALASSWLDKAAPTEANDARSNSAWRYSSKRLRTEKPMPVQNRRRNIIPCADVYLEMSKDGIEAIAPDPALGMTYAVKLNAGTKVGKRHAIKPLAANSKFRQFIERALPDDDVRALVQEQCGLTLLPANYQIASWWVGAAGSGKSTLVELCKAMQRQVACISLDGLSDTFGLEGLVGASLVQVDEVEAEKWAEGKFKSLVSGNGVSINRKHEKALMDYQLRAKWLITSNSKPFVRDKSDGVWRRLCIVLFTVVIPEEERKDDFHLMLLEEEGAQILDWMLEGAQRLVKRGRFMTESERPQAVREAKEESRNDCDSVRAWTRIFSVHVVHDLKSNSALKSKDQVFDEYEAWCLAAHQEPLLRRAFWKGLRGLLPGIENFNRRVEGVQSYFCNVAWTVPAPKLVSSNPKPQCEFYDPPAKAPEPAAVAVNTQGPSEAVAPQDPMGAAEWDDSLGPDPFLLEGLNPFLEGPDPFMARENRA